MFALWGRDADAAGPIWFDHTKDSLVYERGHETYCERGVRSKNSTPSVVSMKVQVTAVQRGIAQWQLLTVYLLT